MSKSTKKNVPVELQGLFFLTFEKNEVQYQGMIVGKVNEDYYIGQLFSWLTGDSTVMKIFNIDEMRGWEFFKDASHMEEECAKKDKCKEVK